MRNEKCEIMTASISAESALGPITAHSVRLPFRTLHRFTCNMVPRAAARILLVALTLAPLAVPSPFAAPPLPGNSLYHMDAAWNTDAATPMKLVELRGKPRVLTMFFSQCDDICPMLTGQLKLLEREMSDALRADIGFVLVTLDPEDDDAETLSDYRRRMGFSRENWILLRGSADDTRELANLLGVTYMPKKADGQIDHNGLLVVLDAEGRVVDRASGISDRKAYLALLRKVAAKK